MALVDSPSRLTHLSDPFAIEAAAGHRERRSSRDTEPKLTHLSPDASSLPRPLSSSNQASSSSSSTTHDYHEHHQLPALREVVKATSPILYLPPLLSPLPSSVALQHRHQPELDHHGLISLDTRLPNIDPASLELHQALHHFAPVDEDYASTPYDEAFNWRSIRLPSNTEREWYCVVFRSRRNPESSSLSLYQADREAHEEAITNGGLVMYWYGVPDHTGLNLATCIWQSRRHAVHAITGPKHVQAMRQAKDAYETYELERWVLKKEAGKQHVSLKKWEGGDVGW